MKLSIIMPVYNVESYLRKSIQSILNQSFDDFELIIINDGSTDESKEIIEDFKEDPRVKYIDIPNNGVSTARNIGINESQGEYLTFIDSDDWIEDKLLEAYMQKLEKYSFDLLITGFVMEYKYKNKDFSFNVTSPEAVVSKNEFIDLFPELLKRNLIPTPWNKVFKSNIIKQNNIKFPKKNNEDIYFVMDYLTYVNDVAIIDCNYYHWNRFRESSQTTKVNSIELVWEAKKDIISMILSKTKQWNFDMKQFHSLNSYYTDRLIQIFMIIMGSDSNLKWKYQYIKLILNDKLTVNTIEKANADTLFKKIIYFFIKKRMTINCMFIGYCINIPKRFFPSLFYKIRSNQVHKVKVNRL